MRCLCVRSALCCRDADNKIYSLQLPFKAAQRLTAPSAGGPPPGGLPHVRIASLTCTATCQSRNTLSIQSMRSALSNQIRSHGSCALWHGDAPEAVLAT